MISIVSAKVESVFADIFLLQEITHKLVMHHRLREDKILSAELTRFCGTSNQPLIFPC
jgi:hypothetical protein